MKLCDLHSKPVRWKTPAWAARGEVSAVTCVPGPWSWQAQPMPTCQDVAHTQAMSKCQQSAAWCSRAGPGGRCTGLSLGSRDSRHSMQPQPATLLAGGAEGRVCRIRCSRSRTQPLFQPTAPRKLAANMTHEPSGRAGQRDARRPLPCEQQPSRAPATAAAQRQPGPEGRDCLPLPPAPRTRQAMYPEPRGSRSRP